jgi:hypothetical protein
VIKAGDIVIVIDVMWGDEEYLIGTKQSVISVWTGPYPLTIEADTGRLTWVDGVIPSSLLEELF